MEGTAYHCPHAGCGVYAKQHRVGLAGSYTLPSGGGSSAANFKTQRFGATLCEHCQNISIWVGERMIYPSSSPAPTPNSDMPDDVKADYEEAGEIVGVSPRGAAALLRLAIERLTPHLKAEGRDLNAQIGNLVTRGLLPTVQQSLDAVRVIGNNAVHPGQINIGDDQDIALSLFSLLNVIVEQMITVPNTVQSIFEDLPESSRQQIERRDTARQADS